jgi:hypothetical protein
MSDKFVMYLIYLAVSVVLTVWVGRTLFRNGFVFLEDSLGSVRLAQSVNHLLVVGFYLLNLGFVSVALRAGGAVASPTAALEELSLKLGLVLLVLGAIHFLNLFVLSRVRHRRTRAVPPPDEPGLPQPPQQQLMYPVDPATFRGPRPEM